jgi:hypothetical protein
MSMHPLLKRTRWTRGSQGPLPPIASLDWDDLGIPDNWDCLARPPMWAWHKLAVHGYPGWDVVGDAPPFILLEYVHEQTLESDEMAQSFDSAATGLFYYRDWTKDNLPWCNAGEVYWSGFWFQRMGDALAFQASYGGIGSWESDFEFQRGKMCGKREAS